MSETLNFSNDEYVIVDHYQDDITDNNEKFNVDFINLYNLSKNLITLSDLDNDILLKLIKNNMIDWLNINYANLSEKFILEHFDKLNYDKLIADNKYVNKKNSNNTVVIKLIKTNVDMSQLILKELINNDILSNHIEIINVTDKQAVHKFANLIVFRHIVCYHNNAEKFIDKYFEHIDEIHWVTISNTDKYNDYGFSNDFIIKYSNKLDIVKLLSNNRFNEDQILVLLNNLNNMELYNTNTTSKIIKKILNCQNIDKSFFVKNNFLKLEKIYSVYNFDESEVLNNIEKFDCATFCATKKITDQRLEKFINHETNWLYKSEEEKINLLSQHYKIITIDNVKYVESYKGIKYNGQSIFAPEKYTYDKINHMYETICNFNSNKANSFGFGSGTFKYVMEYVGNNRGIYKIIRCAIPLDSVCMTKNFKLRSGKLMITDLKNQQQIAFYKRYNGQKK